MSPKKYYMINPEVKLQELEKFNLYRKISGEGGRAVYALFHRKGDPFGSISPSQVYVHVDDLEELLRKNPKAKIFQKKLPAGKIALLMMTNWYEARTLGNISLELREKVELTVHCLNESLRFIKCNLKSSRELCDSLGRISASMLLFTESVLSSREGRRYLLDEVYYRVKNRLPHAVRVCMYFCNTVAAISSKRSFSFDSELLSDTIWGILIHDVKTGPGSFSKLLDVSRSMFHADTQELKKHLDTAYEQDYIDNKISPPVLRIATIADAFDELTGCTENVYVFNPTDAFKYLQRRLVQSTYRPYLDIFVKEFNASRAEQHLHFA